MSFFTALVTSKIAVGVFAGGTLAAGGTAAAAYTGTLPPMLQQAAHDTIGAPAAAHGSQSAEHKSGADSPGKATKDADSAKPNPSATPVGPDATGPAAYGLCKAFTSGGLNPASTAYKALATAAAGSTDIASYCKSVPAPGKSGSHRPENPDDSGNSSAPKKSKPQPPAKADRGQSHKPATGGNSQAG